MILPGLASTTEWRKQRARIAEMTRLTTVGIGPYLRVFHHSVASQINKWANLADNVTDWVRVAGLRALAAVYRARDAVLHGDDEALDVFIVKWLLYKTTSRRPPQWQREAISSVLLGGDWESAASPDVLAHIRRLVRP